MKLEVNVNDGGLFPKRCGKCIMQQQEWNEKKCLNCGGELESIENNEYEEVKQCKDCGRRTLLLKKIKPDLKPPLEKALELSRKRQYNYCPDSDVEKRIDELFKRKRLNCKDRKWDDEE